MTSSQQIDALYQYDSDTFEVGNARLRMRPAWSFIMCTQSDPPTYLLSNPEQSAHFEIGWAQYALLSLLDGRKTLLECVSVLSDRVSDNALNTDQAIASAQWALKIGLAEAVDSRGRPIAFRKNASAQSGPAIALSNPLFVKIPLGDPSQWLAKSVTVDRLVKGLGRLICSGPVVAAWMCLQLVALAAVMLNWPSVVQSTVAIMDPWSGPWLLVTFVWLKLVHELGHAAVCHALGGRVREIGFMFTLFVPIPYVDVSSSWMFPDKWQRIAVAAAGMLVELTIAALSTLLWCQSNDAQWRFHLFNIMVSASAVTLLFNANFLMRFDGYYIFSDSLGISNLYTLGQQAVSRMSSRWLFGEKPSLSNTSVESSWLIASYGVATWLWRIVVAITLVLAAAKLFEGAGVLLAVPTFLYWVARPLRKVILRLADRTSLGVVSRRYWLTRLAPMTGAIVAMSFVCPWPFHVSAPAVVAFRAPQTVRAATAGFVQHVHVEEGQFVNCGDLLVTLENKELELERRRVGLELAACELRCRQQHEQGNIGAFQAEVALREALSSRVEELVSQCAELQLRAPIAGEIIGSDIASLHNCRLEKGQAILEIVASESKELTVSIAQSDFAPFRSAVNSPVSLKPSLFHAAYPGRLTSVQPTATLQCDPRLTSIAGGSLAVRQPASENAEPTANDSSPGAKSPLPPTELLTPRFEGTISLDSATANQLHAGMTVTVTLQRYGSSIASHLASWCRDHLSLGRP